MTPPPVPPKFGTYEYSAIPITPSTPPSPPHTASFPSNHLRRRSSVNINFESNDVTIQLDADSEKRYGKMLKERSSKETKPLNGVGSGSGKGYMAWTDGRAKSRRTGVKRCIAFLALFLFCVLGWLGGLATSEVSSRGQGSGKGSSTWSTSTADSKRCNPYEHHGVLNVNASEPKANAWQPFSASPECQPVDYLTLLHDASVQNTVSPVIKFVENRTIVLFGDSIDRDHNEHICQFLQGSHEMIGSDHPLSPSYPLGQELPPVNYTSFLSGRREWPNFVQSRPWVCHVPKLNLRVVNVFHYGFQEPEFDNGYIATHPHFYPPAAIEDRFSQIVIPLMEGLSKRHNISAVPDIFSIAPGFWSHMRQSVDDQSAQKVAIEAGMAEEEAKAKFDPWRSMDQGEKKWFEGRFYETLRYCARSWKEGRDVGGNNVRPTILWRASHPIKELDTVPFNRLMAVDRIGRYVVENLIEESKAASEGGSSWIAWTGKIGEKALGWRKESKTEIEDEDLARRLRIDEWGSRMIGQTRYFRDQVHPLALPGSWLYGNMLLHQLRMTVDDETSR